MRILYHHRTQAEDAQGIHIREMVMAFRDLGHEVEIAALVEPEQDGERKTRGKKWNWLVRWAPCWLYELMGLAYNLYGFYHLCQSIRARRPDLIYERYALNTFCGIWASRRLRIPLLLEVNAPLYYEQSKFGKLAFKRLARRSERWICSHSTWTVVVSRTMKNFLMREGVPERKMIVIPNGVNPQRFHPGISGETIRKRYRLEGRLVIGFVGWFRQWHGLEMLVDVARTERFASRGIRFLLVGDGPAFSNLHRSAKKQGVLPAFVFAGAVERKNIPDHIAAMDIAVQPSATDYACPMKIFEYMAMGRCIVAPNQPNIREFLEDGVNGYLFTPGDQNHFNAVLMKAILDPTNRRFVGYKAYETIYQCRYLWSANAKKALGLVLGQTVQQPCPAT